MTRRGAAVLTWLRDLVERIRFLVFRDREDRELQEELQFHLDMEAEQRKRGGLGPAEARRQSAIALGGVERARAEARDARGTRFVEESIGDIAFAVRSLAATPGFALAAILTLAIGIGGTTAVYGAVDAVLIRPLPYRQPAQLVRLYQNTRQRPEVLGFVTPVHFVEFRARVSSFDALAAVLTYNTSGADVGSGEAARRIRVLPVSGDYFDVLGVRPVVGRPFDRRDETGALVVLLSHATWLSELHGDPSAVGRAFTMNGQAYTVAGVMPDGFGDVVAGPIDAWVPLDLRPGYDPNQADNHYLTVLGRLHAGTTLAGAQSELTAVAEQLTAKYPDTEDARARLYPLKDDVVEPSSRALRLMLGAVVLVLVLVCVNIANLMLVRGSSRAREFAVRTALGAGRARLIRQVLLESLMLALAGDAASLVVAWLATSAIVSLGGDAIPRLATTVFDGRQLVMSLVVATASAVAFGLVPAVRASRVQPGDALRAQGRASTATAATMRLREVLVVAQVALAFVLLAGAGLLVASMQRLGRLDLGIKPDNVLVFELHLPDARYPAAARAEFYERAESRMAALPGVAAAGGVSRLPATGPYHQWGVTAASGPLANSRAGHSGGVQQRVVSGDYFKAVGIPILEGRQFDARDTASAPRRYIVSRSLARQMFPGLDAVGQRLTVTGIDGVIIGVAGDVAVTAEGESGLYVYHAHAQMAANRNWALTQVVRASGSLDSVRGEARQLLASLDPQLVMFEPSTLSDAIGRGEAQRQFTLRMLAAFAGVALALSALGLFGVLAHGVRLRAHEFGLRMALGAEAGRIRRLVLRRGLALVAAGTAFGLLGALALSHTMASLVFQVSPLDPAVLAGTAAFLSAVAGLAAYLPARSATAVEPRTVLQ